LTDLEGEWQPHAAPSLASLAHLGGLKNSLQQRPKRYWSYANWGRPQAVNREKRSDELSIKRLILNMDKKKKG